MRIIFFRHGIARDRLPRQDDAARPLSEEGVLKTTRVVAALAKFMDAPWVILTSPKLRARQTAALLGKQLHVEPRVVEALGVGSAEQVVRVLAALERSGEPELPGAGAGPGAGEARDPRSRLRGQGIGAGPGTGSARAQRSRLCGKETKVVIVGHEPDLGEAIEMLLSGRTGGWLELKKAGAACVRTTGPIRWGQACVNLLWLTTPGLWK